MRELLYLSENKMRALVPQLPGRLRRKLGFEAGLNAGVASVTATLPSEPQPSSIAALDAVIKMIEKNRGTALCRTSQLGATAATNGQPARRSCAGTLEFSRPYPRMTDHPGYSRPPVRGIHPHHPATRCGSRASPLTPIQCRRAA